MTKRAPSALTAAVLALALAAAPAAAQSEDKSQQPGEMAREGIERLMNAIETFVQSLPQYGVPRIDEEGNIVIPRLDKADPQPEKTPERKPAPPTGEGDGGVTEIRL